MARKEKQTEPERRCIVTGASGPRLPLVRFVLGPDGAVVPDLEEKLPGRGAWITASADAFSKAEKKPPFARAFRSSARPPEKLGELVTDLLLKRCMNLLGLARSAGQVVAGYEKVREFTDRGPAGAILVASDAGETALSRARNMAFEAPLLTHFGRDELSLALGRENVVHAAVAPGRLAVKFVRDAERYRLLAGLPDSDMSEKRNLDD